MKRGNDADRWVLPRMLKFTPLEFETSGSRNKLRFPLLKFTPLEFETDKMYQMNEEDGIG